MVKEGQGSCVLSLRGSLGNVDKGDVDHKGEVDLTRRGSIVSPSEGV